jgi:hypothetical protein
MVHQIDVSHISALPIGEAVVGVRYASPAFGRLRAASLLPTFSFQSDVRVGETFAKTSRSMAAAMAARFVMTTGSISYALAGAWNFVLSDIFQSPFFYFFLRCRRRSIGGEAGVPLLKDLMDGPRRSPTLAGKPTWEASPGGWCLCDVPRGDL